MKKEDSKKSTIIFEDFQQLEVFTLTENIKKFSDLIGEIRTLCFEYDEIWDGTMKPMSESEFYDLVKHYFNKLFQSEIK